LEERNRQLEAQVAILTQQLDYLKRQLFGRKSEQFDHPELFGEDGLGKAESSDGVDAPEEDGASGEDGPKTKGDKRRRPIREQRLPENLPVIREEIIPAAVKAEPERWRPAGQEESTQLEKEPGYFYLRRTVRLKFAPIDEPFAPPIIAPARPTMIEGGFWGPGLLAEVLTNKYVYHLPFYRQHVCYLQRHGVDLSESTMSDCAEKVSDQLGILLARMKAGMLAEGYVGADETPTRYLDPCHPQGSATGYFWAYRGGGGDVIFDWQTSREHHHAVDWLGPHYEGVLQSDGYGAYAKYCKRQAGRGKRVRRAACLAHIRRKFEAAKDERPEVVGWVLRIMAQLYRIETPLRDYEASAEVRARVRENRSRPLILLLEKAFKYLRTTRILPKSRLGQALDYALGQWPDMMTYLEDGRVAIDNNDIENDIRPSAVGKKNWLFVGSPEAGRRGAILYSLLISARNHGVDPQAYLRDVIERLPTMSPADLDALLPANWAAANRDRHPAIKPKRRHAA
jgi:transposase